MSSGAKTVCQEDIKSLAQANNNLAVHLHQSLSQEKENIFFSPFSISVAMGMLLCAAEGETASEMRIALGHEKAGIQKGDIASVFEQQMSLLLQPNDSYTLSFANSMLNQHSFQVKEEYKEILTKSFKALTMDVDLLKENEKIINHINDWVKEKTTIMIPKLGQSLDSYNVLILLNSVYLKKTSMKQLKNETTFMKKFYNKGIEEDAKEVEMMCMKDSLPFLEKNCFQALQLPYIGEEIAMMILLPRTKDGLASMEANLSPTFVDDLKGKLRVQTVKISFPRFRIEYMKSLVPYFSELGVKRVFRRGAELTVASDSPDLAVSEILHKAELDINEECREAFAAAMVAGVMYDLDVETEFVADHPFLFLLYNTKSDFILFMGRANEL